MSEYRTGDPICNCRDSTTAGKPWCPVHDAVPPQPTAPSEAVELLRAMLHTAEEEWGVDTYQFDACHKATEALAALEACEVVEGWAWGDPKRPMFCAEGYEPVRWGMDPEGMGEGIRPAILLIPGEKP